tara:strand:- start:2419 stop:2769 length:351 start_codon:yes stop_codon:yes gene_type:complete
LGKKEGMFIIKIESGPDREEVSKEYKPKKEEQPKQKTNEEPKKDFGGYTPESLISAMEEIKDAIADSKARLALSRINSCIVRITGRELPEEKDPKDPFIISNFQLDNTLSNQGQKQ